MTGSPATEPALTLEYPGLPPKEFSPNYTGPWRKRWRAGVDAKNSIIALLSEQGWSMVPLERAVVRFKIGLPDELVRDDDNLYAACKPFRDALVGRVIKNDHIGGSATFEYSWFDSPKKPCTIITVEANDAH